MVLCPKCDEKLSESSRFCTNCGARVAEDNKNMSSSPQSRIEKKKYYLRKKRFMAVGGLIFGLLLLIGVFSFIVKGSHKPEPKTDVAATTTVNQSKDKAAVKKDASGNNTTKEKSNNTPTLSSTDYILSASNQRVMNDQDMASLSKGQLRLARNEIYARHGYIFKSKDLQKYFASKSWYHPDPAFKGALSEVEKQNVAILKAKEDSL